MTWFMLPSYAAMLTLVLVGVVWLLVPAARKTCKRALHRGTVVGAVFFLVGFVGPLILTPESNQGPLLGFFCTGPLGFAIGTALGALTSPPATPKGMDPPA